MRFADPPSEDATIRGEMLLPRSATELALDVADPSELQGRVGDIDGQDREAASTRSALAALLELDGHTVHVARDGPSGAALILRCRPDLSLIDVGLPELDGYGVAQLVRAHPDGQSLRLIALTGYDRKEDRERARSAGFDGHAAKPIGAATLAELVAGRSGPNG